MFLLGTVVNAVAVFIGSVIGLVLPSIPERMKTTIMQGLSLAVILIGLSMALSDMKDILIIIISMVLGALLGEWIDIEAWLLRFGQAIEKRAKRLGDGQVAEAFVAASLLFCVGSMAIVGAIQSGVSGDNTTLYAKSTLDFFSSIVFTSTLGFGVAISALAVFFYEGIIAALAYFAGTAMNSAAVIGVMTASGGLLIVAIGINILGLKKIAVGNLLPAMFLAAIIKALQSPVVHFGTNFLHQL